MAKKEIVDHKASLGTYVAWLYQTNRLTNEETATLLMLIDSELAAQTALSNQGC